MYSSTPGSDFFFFKSKVKFYNLVVTRMNMEDLLLSEASQTQKVRHHVTFLMRDLKTNPMTSLTDSEAVTGMGMENRAGPDGSREGWRSEYRQMKSYT